MAAIIGLLFLQTFVTLYNIGGGDASCGFSSHTEVALRVCSNNCSDDGSQEFGSETKVSYNETSPQCACRQMCSEVGECCFYSTIQKEASWHPFDFVCVSGAGVGRYHAVTTCLDNKSSNLCQINLGHMAPVTSGVTGTTYGNFYCANCNEDSEQLVPWQLDRNCNPVPEDSGNSSTWGPIYVSYDHEVYRLRLSEERGNLCQFHVRGGKIPFGNDLSLRPCNSTSMVSECSPSWEDPSVEEKCGSHIDPVHHHNTVYRNAHCAQCNFVNLSYVQCDPHHSERRAEKKRSPNARTTRDSRFRESGRNLAKPEGYPYAFSELINTGCSPPAGSTCCAGERYDFITKKCRKIYQRDAIR